MTVFADINEVADFDSTTETVQAIKGQRRLVARFM